MKENFFIESYTLKHEEGFAIFDLYGNIDIGKNNEEGIYYEGTRFLSYWKFYLFDKNPILLSSAVKEDNSLLTVDLTNPDIIKNGEIIIPEGNIHILRSKFLYENCCYEKIYLKNFFLLPVELELNFYFNNDFADIFEVRGYKNPLKTNKLRLLKTVEKSGKTYYVYEEIGEMDDKRHILKQS